jgi:hypothetical protein
VAVCFFSLEISKIRLAHFEPAIPLKLLVRLLRGVCNPVGGHLHCLVENRSHQDDLITNTLLETVTVSILEWKLAP